MLLSLHIENIAIISMSDIDFSNGFNVLTGETGAGKSIIIDSINLLLGNKSAKNLIRTGCDYALVSAVFTEFNDYQIELLKNNDITPDDDGNIIVSRKITIDGRSYSKINGVAVTVTTLKNISHILVNIHGQHENSKILDPSTHIYYLDEYCDNSGIISEYSKQYDNVKSIRNRISELSQIKEQKEQIEETLKFKIDEIQNAKIVVGELQKLKESASIAENITTILSALHACDSLLSNDESSIIDSVSDMASNLSSVEKILDGTKDIVENLNRAKIELEDASIAISKKLSEYDEFDVSPEFIEKRIYEIESVLKKYGTEQQALESLENYKCELSKLEDNEIELSETTLEYSKALKKLEAVAEKLSLSRKDNAEKLSSLICIQLEQLDMPNIKFEVSIKRNINSRGGNKYTQLGYDVVEFLISTNAGQDLRPLAKIASGGELSRIILCLKSILAGDNAECQTIIYDEVDSGVSGSTAQKIGLKLKKSAKDKQVFSITHLAQIASLADYHYKIEKNTTGNITTSNIRLLNSDERIYEIARIMGGVEITDQILKSAKELINNSKMC